jgi:phospholipase C
MSTDRRTFIQLLSAAALSAAFPASISRALSLPANNRTGTIEDVEYIVILMQENRSFDHYFGTLRGVRGYSDPRPIPLPTGNQVWYQPNGDSYLLPFHPGAPNLGLQFIEDLPHDWKSTHAAWDLGKYDQWVPNKGTTTMAYLVRADIPFHYALADAFTICDAYHCSLLGPTHPNRYYLWTGWTGNNYEGNGPALDNSDYGYTWGTYPERLLQAGITCKIYQDIGQGLVAPNWGYSPDDAFVGNYGDNGLLSFLQYQNAQPGTPLYEVALTGTNVTVSGTIFDQFAADVKSGQLPQVSWLVPPEAYTEHPNWPANYGAWYVSQILDILTENPDVWSKTAFFLIYDENDGFFDHVVPPTVPPSAVQGASTVDTSNEIFRVGTTNYPLSEFPAGPYGLGPRLPAIVISPWSKGGWVNSEVFDHTSIIRFLERRFGIIEPNITPWRRAVCGDLTSAFNFKSPNNAHVNLPSTVAYTPPDNQRHPSYVPTPPTTQSMPFQETGIRPARPVPYELNVSGQVDFADGSFSLSFGNSGQSAAVYQVYTGQGQFLPRTYTVSPGAELSDTWNFSGIGQSTYDISVYGPNGFFRVFAGSFAGTNANLTAQITYDVPQKGVWVVIANYRTTDSPISLYDAYTKQTTSRILEPQQNIREFWSLERFYGWYDFTLTTNADPSFQRRLAGHLETCRDSMSDPFLGTAPS